MTAMKWFFSFIKKYRLRLFIATLLVIVVAAFAIIGPYISGIIVDEVIKEHNTRLLLTLIIILIVTTISRSIFRFIFLMIFEQTSQDILFELRDDVYKNLIYKDFSFYNKNRTGDLMSRQTGDMDAIRHFIAYAYYSIFEYALLFIFALGMIFTIDYRLALSMTVILPFIAINTYRQSKEIKPAFFNIRNRFSSLNTAVQENISGSRVVKAFAKEEYEIEKFNKENDGYMDAELKATAIWSKYFPTFEFLSSFLVIILILVGSIMVINNDMSLGDLVTINGYLWMLNVPLRMAGWLVNDLQRFTTSVSKIYGTISQEPLVKNSNSPVKKIVMKGDVTFKNVYFEANGITILKDINFSISSGQTIGIIGATGSGKSTLMNLLCRFYDPAKGDVLIDNISIKDMDLHFLRDNIGMAMQDVFLFSDTIEGNIAYGKTDCTFEDILRVSKIANAHEFIEKMPDGYDTIIGERGIGLSGGQKQRISLARALLKDPSIIILDDTTSAVDMETETQIQNELKSIQGKRTVFVIAHRISSIINADIILVLDNGKIIEVGNHFSLLERKGYYYTVFNHQYGEFDSFSTMEDI